MEANQKLASKMTTLTPDETALDVFQRFSSIVFDVRITGTKVEEISLHSNVEVLASPSEVSEVSKLIVLLTLFLLHPLNNIFNIVCPERSS